VLADDSASGDTTWMLADQQGTVRDVINSGRTVLDHIVYDPYGNILSQTNSSYQPRFAFGGMQLDQATGLYYDNARFYDSGTGTFISQDPLGFGGGTTDLYDYVCNDPTNLIDPSGLSPKAHPTYSDNPPIGSFTVIDDTAASTAQADQSNSYNGPSIRAMTPGEQAFANSIDGELYRHVMTNPSPIPGMDQVNLNVISNDSQYAGHPIMHALADTSDVILSQKNLLPDVDIETSRAPDPPPDSYPAQVDHH